MPYDFTTLSPADFEDLAADLVGKSLGCRLETFAAGPDGGMDGRHTRAGGSTILQAKHYANSPFATLRSRMTKERAAIYELKPERYLLATSCRLTPLNKSHLQEIIGPALKAEGDILGPSDLNGLLRDFPDVEKAHIKLWLSSTPVLDRLLRSASYTFNKITREEIEAKIRIYAPNRSFDQALEILEGSRVLIVSGPPGVGKTTLAEILVYAYMAKDWELIAIRSLDDGLASIDDKKKQIFLFDDFLGRVALDKQALAHNDSDLARFIKRVRRSPNARFILTTRAYIFEEARRISEPLADQKLDVSKYVLDVGIYTRRIRARILYNHLLIAGTPKAYIAALVGSKQIDKIVDHKNYNPRVVEWMTDVDHLESVDASKYLETFIGALDNPSALWDIAFRTHISASCRHLLIALFFSPEHGVAIDELRQAYDALHPVLCARYAQPHDPKDFEESLRILEGGFVALRNGRVTFVNPSLRDYLSTYLNDLTILIDCARSACQSDWAYSVWNFGNSRIPELERRAFAQAFRTVAEKLPELPVWRRHHDGTTWYSYPVGLSNVARIELLSDWYTVSDEPAFAAMANALTLAPVEGLDSWRDGGEAVRLSAEFREGNYHTFPDQELLANQLDAAIVSMLEIPMPLDELESISDAIEERTRLIDQSVKDAANKAIDAILVHIDQAIESVDSESTLQEYVRTITKLADRTMMGDLGKEVALSAISDRLGSIAAKEVGSGPSIPATSPEKSTDKFDDRALMALFAPLVDEA